MPFNGAGVYTPPATDFPAISGTLIQSSKFNNVINDLASGLSTCITKDGQTTITANLKMDGFKHTNVAATSGANSRTEYASAGTVQDGVLHWAGVATGTADALALTLTPALTSYGTGGLKIRFKSSASANTGAATVNVNGLGAKTIQKNGAALVAGDIAASKLYEIIYDGTNFQLISTQQGATLTGTETLTGKTLTNPAGTTQTLTDAATIAWDMNSGHLGKVTLTAVGRTMGAPTNIKAGGRYTLYVVQDATGSRTITTWNAVFKFPLGLAPELSTAAGAVDVFDFVSFDGVSLEGGLLKGVASV